MESKRIPLANRLGAVPIAHALEPSMSAPLHPHRAGWAVRHTLVAIALLTVLAVGLHWWRTRRMPDALGIPPTVQIYSGRGSVSSLVFSSKADELFVAVGEAVEVYDPATGNKKRSWKTGIDGITHFALSADGSVAMTAGYDSGTGTINSIVKSWDLSSDKGDPVELSRIAKRGTYPSGAALSPDGSQLAVAEQSVGTVVGFNIHVFDVSSGTEKFACTGLTNVAAGLSFSPDGTTLVSLEWNSTLRKWEMASGQQSASWTVSSTGPMIASFGMGGKPLTYSTDGKSLVVAGAGNGFEVRDAATGAVRATANVKAYDLSSVALSANDALVAAAGNTYTGSTSFLFSGGNTEGTAGIWDAATGKNLVMLQQNGPGVQSLAFSPDGKWIAVGDENGMVSLWDVKAVLGAQR